MMSNFIEMFLFMLEYVAIGLVILIAILGGAFGFGILSSILIEYLNNKGIPNIASSIISFVIVVILLLIVYSIIACILISFGVLQSTPTLNLN